MSANVPQVMRRESELSKEMLIVILRLVQLRDYPSFYGSKVKITSLKCNGKELRKFPSLKEMDLSSPNISKGELETIAKLCGYVNNTKNGVITDIVINGKATSVRCFSAKDRPFFNHTSRDKFLKICQYLGMDIKVFDQILDSYWLRRQMGAIKEDCEYDTPLNPFKEHKSYIAPIFTLMAFSKFNYNKNPKSPEFIKDTIGQILDFRIPWDENTWQIYTPQNYLDTIWKSLRFSMRDTKGMPANYDPNDSAYEEIHPWTRAVVGRNGDIRYKGALHTRVVKYDNANKGTSFDDLYRERIAEVKGNKGEQDEIILKLFLVECREKKLAIPLGSKCEIVTSVGTKTVQYGKPPFITDWKKLDASELVFMQTTMKIEKASANMKSDVYVNGIGISVKSERGEMPAIINHTTREKILRVMNAIHQPIAPLDTIISSYWELRLAKKVTEDVANGTANSPFTNQIQALKPLLTYFSFDGTGTRDSLAPADLILTMKDPTDIATWTYYNRDTFISSIWKNLVFSVRSKAMPSKYSPDDSKYTEIHPWVRMCDGSYRGALHVRVGKSQID